MTGAAAGVAYGDEQGVFVPRSPSAIVIDGVLDDRAWTGAARIDTFYETAPGNNVEPPVRTLALVTYDGRYLYVGIRCDDPDPSRIRRRTWTATTSPATRTTSR